MDSAETSVLREESVNQVHAKRGLDLPIVTEYPETHPRILQIVDSAGKFVQQPKHADPEFVLQLIIFLRVTR